MFYALPSLLLIFKLTTAENLPNSGSEIFAANIHDDTILKNMQHRLDLFQMSHDSLRLKIDTLNINLEQQQTIQRNELKKYFEDLKASLTDTMNSCKTRELKDTENKNVRGNVLNVRNALSNINPPNDPNQCPNNTIPQYTIPSSCAKALQKNGRNGIYQIKIPNSDLNPFYVYCLKATSKNDSAWLVIQRRQDGNVNFYRDWKEYRQGFGNLDTEFFIGLNKLHAITQSKLHELWIEMEDFEGIKHWAKYKSFAIGSADEDYALNILGTYTGDAGDSFSMHASMKWSTKDKDNDENAKSNCAVDFAGAWWYRNCHESNLNGQYLRGNYSKEKGKGIEWFKWHGHNYSLKYVHMAIRPLQ